MSVLGNKNAPLHKIYNAWLILLGVIIIISSIYIFSLLHNTSGIILFLFIVLLLYALGGCIIAGLFAVEETKELVTMQAKIHGISAVIGFLLLTLAPLLIGIYFIKISYILLGILSLLCFIVTILFFVLFILADKPKFNNSIINSEGL